MESGRTTALWSPEYLVDDIVMLSFVLYSALFGFLLKFETSFNLIIYFLSLSEFLFSFLYYF